MRSPPLVPGFDVDVYIVLDDFGPLGRAYRETSEDRASREAVIRDLIRGEYSDPVRVVRFNTQAGTSEDVSLEIAKEILAWATRKDELLPLKLRDFIDYQLDLDRRYQPVKA